MEVAILRATAYVILNTKVSSVTFRNVHKMKSTFPIRIYVNLTAILPERHIIHPPTLVSVLLIMVVLIALRCVVVMV